MLFLIVARTVTNCSIVLHCYFVVKEKVSFTPQIKTFHAGSVSISAVLMKAMGKKFEVLRKCRDSVTMATIYVVMLGKNVYEYSRVYVLNLQGIVNIRCHLETFQAWSKNFGDSPRSIF